MNKRLPLGSVLSEIIDHRGKTPKKLGADFTDFGIPVASALLVHGGRLHLDDARCVAPDVASRWMPIPLCRGDVLLTSEAPLGRVAWVDSDEPLVLGQRLFALRAKPDILDSKYLGYWLMSDSGQAALASHQTGSTVSGIRQSALRRVEIPVPSLATQQAIGEVLGALDDKIVANHRVLQAVLDLGRSLVMNVDAEAVRLGEVASITMGTSPRGEDLNETKTGMPFFQGVRDFGHIFPAERVHTMSPVRTAARGDVLFAVRAPVGRVNLAVTDVAIGRGLGALIAASSPATLLFGMSAQEHLWQVFDGGGTVFASVNRREVENMTISWPQDSLAVETRVRPLLDRAVAAEQENTTLTAVRDELLPQLMSGRITVKDAEKRVEEEV